MKALVTGAGGFIGRHLIERLLRDGHAVRALVREAGRPGEWPATVEVVAGDVRDPQAMKAAAAGCETVFHLAGKAHALSEIREDAVAHRAINVDGTRNVFEGAVAGGARRFVFFSSVKAMGEGGLRCQDESFDGRPATAYGHSKLEAERLVLDGGGRAGLHAVCLRLPLVYGIGNKGNLYRMIAAIDKDRFPPLPEVGNRRSMVHVANVVDAAVLAAGDPAANGRCYIVTDARPHSTRELYELICRALDKPVPGWSVPVWTLRALGRIGDAIGLVRGRRFVFDSDALDKLIGSAWYSSERIARELGYRPAMSLENALPELIAWHRKEQA